MDIKNIFDNINVDKNNEEFIKILRDKNIRIERIVSNGQISDENFWYNQDENEFVLLLDGEAILEFENREITLKKGDFIDIKSRTKNRIKYTYLDEPTIRLAIFYY